MPKATDKAQSKKRARAMAPILLAVATLAVAGGFGLFLSAQGRTDDFVEFLLDRREGLGQTTPDRGADCTYQLGESSVRVTRKAHGQTTELDVQFDTPVVEGFFGGQEALIETRTTAETYNCTNGEHLTHDISADPGNPISRVLFSTSGRNVAIVLNRGGESGLETFKFKVDPGESAWNERFGADEKGLKGQVTYARLAGESLLAAVFSGGKLELHTYNFRSSHKANPWNGQDQDDRKPLVVSGKLIGQPEFLERGKRAEVRVRSGTATKTYTYDFTCKLQPPAGETVNPKPCEWKTAQ
jgi:hypothetical protein